MRAGSALKVTTEINSSLDWLNLYQQFSRKRAYPLLGINSALSQFLISCTQCQHSVKNYKKHKKARETTLCQETKQSTELDSEIIHIFELADRELKVTMIQNAKCSNGYVNKWGLSAGSWKVKKKSNRNARNENDNDKNKSCLWQCSSQPLRQPPKIPASLYACPNVVPTHTE